MSEEKPDVVDTLETLLAMIADPKAYAAKLAEMKAARDAAAAEHAKLEENTEAFDADYKASLSSLSARENAVATREAAMGRLDERSAQVEQRHAELADIEQKVNEDAKDRDRREANLKQRESKIANAETASRVAAAALDKRASDLAAAERDYNERVASLRKLVG